VEEEMKENKDVFDLIEVDINVKSTVVELQAYAKEEPNEEDKDDEEILKNMTRVTSKLKKKKIYAEYKFWSNKKKKL
jgi:hypothetical protein